MLKLLCQFISMFSTYLDVILKATYCCLKFVYFGVFKVRINIYLYIYKLPLCLSHTDIYLHVSFETKHKALICVLCLSVCL
jgi:hypothetical protein